jgi:hypothetical protein
LKQRGETIRRVFVFGPRLLRRSGAWPFKERRRFCSPMSWPSSLS